LGVPFVCCVPARQVRRLGKEKEKDAGDAIVEDPRGLRLRIWGFCCAFGQPRAFAQRTAIVRSRQGVMSGDGPFGLHDD
jgi:hypothetical protein